MSHPNQRNPLRLQVSRAPANPRPARRVRLHALTLGRRHPPGKTGPGPKFPPDPTRLPQTLNPQQKRNHGREAAP